MKRKKKISILLRITAILFLSVLGTVQAHAQFNTFSARAISVNATIGGVNAILNDTGELPPSGGFINKSLESGNLFGGALTTGELDATIQGSGKQSRSQAIVYNLNLNVGGNNIASSVVSVGSQCTCTNNGPICEGGLFGDLRINGANIAITGQPNQTITLQGGGTVIINEQILTGSGNAPAITINGVHVIIPGLADVIISSAHSDIVCGTEPEPTNFFGGRAISINATIGGVNAILNDTGELPPSGGFITRFLASGNLFGGALTTAELSAITQGTFIQSRSQAQVANLNLTAGGNNITSDLVPASSQCTCQKTGPPICEGGVLIANLRINGVFIPVAGINQTITLPGGGTVIINEQILTGSGNTASITINGVHVIIPAVADVIISSARSNIVCGPASAPVLVSGRVLNSTGRGVYNAIVTLTDSKGEVRSAITNPFGYYRFFEVAVGETYTVRVRSKRYTFMPQVITPNNEITNLNFVANQQ